MRYIFCLLLLVFLQSSVSAQGQIVLQDKSLLITPPVDTQSVGYIKDFSRFLTLSTDQNGWFTGRIFSQ